MPANLAANFTKILREFLWGLQLLLHLHRLDHSAVHKGQGSSSQMIRKYLQAKSSRQHILNDMQTHDNEREKHILIWLVTT